MPIWDIKKQGDLVKLDSEIKPLCDHCKNELKFTDFLLNDFPLEKDGKTITGRAMDIFFLCPWCSADQCFGVAINEEEFFLLKRIRANLNIAEFKKDAKQYEKHF